MLSNMVSETAVKPLDAHVPVLTRNLGHGHDWDEPIKPPIRITNAKGPIRQYICGALSANAGKVTHILGVQQKDFGENYKDVASRIQRAIQEQGLSKNQALAMLQSLKESEGAQPE